MLALSSRTCLKRIPRAGIHSVEPPAHPILAHRSWRSASSVSQPAPTTKDEKQRREAQPHPARTGIRHKPEFPADIAHQANMNNTTHARFAMQLMELAEKGHYAQCLSIAARMKELKMQPDLSTYTSLILAAARDGSWLDAWAILDDMMLMKIKPDVRVFNHLINAQRHRSSQYLWVVINKMRELGVAPDSTTFSYIIRRFVDDENLEVSLQYFYMMKSRNLIPEVRTAQALICLAARAEYPRLAIDLALYFEQTSVRRLDHVTWMSVLASSAEVLYADGVLLCWKVAVQDMKIAPDEGLCLSVLHTAGRHGLPDLATDVLRVLKLIKAEWKEYHFVPLVEAFYRAGQVKEAMFTFDVMRSNGIEPITSTAYPLLDGLKQDIDTIDAIWTTVDEIHKEGRKIDVVIFQALIRAYITLEDLQRAMGTYKSLHEYGISPDLTMFNALLQGCVLAGHRELGNLLLDDMQKTKIKPDQETYEHFISLCFTQEHYDDAFFYLEEMKSAGHTPSRSIYELIIYKCMAAGDMRYSVAVEEMKEAGYPVLERLDYDIRETVRRMQGDVPPVAKEVERLPDVGLPEELDGSAKTFIETGGLAGVETLGKTPSTYAQA